ncbi:beta strand repeat-containing protein [Schlesneria paludicola]|uniref:beta strand repeat-containing protein n=1 Tax=Schlesneria paludicola TaxID=360056 RepID=UPI0012FB8315|nr:hypothetical protein [Schlesneria paludicola]
MLSATAAVAAINSAPVLQNVDVNLSPIYEDQTTSGGYLVSDILLGRLTDADSGALSGIALTGSVSGTGTWQYSSNSGSTWSNVGIVTAGASLLLRSNDLIRFVPDTINGTAASFTFRGWDQTTGASGVKVDSSVNSGATAFSAVQVSANLNVMPMNDAPVLSGANNFTSISATAVNNPGELVSTLISGRMSDVDPDRLQGIAVTGFTSGTGGWQYSLDNGSSWNNLETAFVSSSLLLRSTDRLRYVPYGTDATTASVTFRAWDQTSGSAGTRKNTTASGGSTAYSNEQATAQIAVTAATTANHAPVLLSGNIVIGTISEDQTTNGGYRVGDLVSGRLTDPDAGALSGIAVTNLTSGTGVWQFSTNAGTTWSNVGSVTPGSSLLLRSNDFVRLVPNGKNGTTASLTFRGWDQTIGTAGIKVDTTVNGDATAFSAVQIDGNLNVTSMNDAPVLAGANDFTPITTNDVANAGNLVSTLIAGKITDVDPAALQGIAIVGFVNGTGGWQYSLDNGTSWTNIDTVFASSALLLRPTDRLRYAPYGNDPTTASLTFLAWDQTSGAAGTRFNATAPGGGVRTYSSQQATSHITVSAVNHAPVLTSGNINVAPITEDQTTNGGYLVQDLLLGRLTDVDTGALSGLALTGTTSGSGTWQYSINGGSTWTNVGAVSATSSLPLRSNDLVRFVPNEKNGTTASLTFRGWDQTSGVAGAKVNSSTVGGTTAFSEGQVTANLVVTSLNDAPVLTGANAFATITEDQATNSGNQVSALIAGKITDVDAGALQGVALTGLNNSSGKWQYSLNNGSTWTDIVSVSVDSALLLRSSDRLRFVPNLANGTTASVTFRAWDQTSGTAGTKVNTTSSGGTRAYSSVQATANLTVTSVNDAPVLGGAVNFSNITEDQAANGGSLVSSLIAGKVTDVDVGSMKGIAVVGVANGNGKWQYQLDQSQTWSDVGTVSGTSALLLRSTDRLRFVPNGLGPTAASVTFRAWDQTAGATGTKTNITSTGLVTPFSSALATSNIAVTSINDAPGLTGANNFTNLTRTQATNSGNLVSTLIAGKVTDVDSNAVQGIAIVGLSSGNGKWQYSTNGGQTWVDVGAVSGSAALLLRSSDRLRFVPNSAAGTTSSVTFRAWDQTAGTAGAKFNIAATGQATAFSSVTAVAKLTVT